MDNIKNIIFECIKDIGLDTDSNDLTNPNLETMLYPDNLDSISLVSLIADIEDRLSNEFNKNIILANEKAMSAKNSPFKSVQSLIDYSLSLVNDKC